MLLQISDTDEFIGAMEVIRESLVDSDNTVALDLKTYDLFKRPDYTPRPTERQDGRLNGYVRTIQLGFNCETRDGLGLQFLIHVARPDSGLNRIWQLETTTTPGHEKQVPGVAWNVITEHLKPMLETAWILGMNLKRVYQFMWKQFGIDLQRTLDVSLMSQVLYCGDKINHGRAGIYGRMLPMAWFWSKTETNFKEYDAIRKELKTRSWHPDSPLDDLMVRRSADDVFFVHKVFEETCERMEGWRQANEPEDLPSDKGIVAVSKLENAFIQVPAMMELRGLKIDRTHQEELIARLKRESAYALERMDFCNTETVKRVNRWCLLENGKEVNVQGKGRVLWEEEVKTPINVRSPQQLKPKLNELFSQEFGEQVEVSSVSDPELKDIIKRAGNHLSKTAREKLNWLLRYRKAEQLLSDYGPKTLDFVEPGTECIHPVIYQIGTQDSASSSGRISGTDPNPGLWIGRGVAFGGIPSDPEPLQLGQAVRGSIVAPEGMVLIDCDAEQEEPRIVTEITQEPYLLNVFNNNGDFYGAVAYALIPGLPRQPQKNDPDTDLRFYRELGKIVGLSLIYGASEESLMETVYEGTGGRIHWSFKEAKAAKEAFFDRMPLVKRAIRNTEARVSELAEKSGFTLAPFKFERRHFAKEVSEMWRHRRFCLKPEQSKLPDEMLHRDYKPKDGEVKVYWERLSSASRKAFNHKIQATGADIIKIAALNIHKDVKRLGWSWKEGIILLSHDQILAQFNEEHAQEGAHIIKSRFEEAGRLFVKSVPFVCETKILSNWGQGKA